MSWFYAGMASKRIEAIKEAIAEANPKALLCDGHVAALLGVCERFGMEPVAAYDYDRYIQLLLKGGMAEDEAAEWFDFNVIGAWMGKGTPVFIRRFR